VNNPNGRDSQLVDPAAEYFTHAENRILAVFDDPDAVTAAIDDLVQVGLEAEQIFVLSGPKGAESLDLSGRHHGLRGRLYRLAAMLGDEWEKLDYYKESLEQGALLISVPADEEHASAVAEVLRSRGAHEMTHYDKGHFESLGP
jgi:hypothetical protein